MVDGKWVQIRLAARGASPMGSKGAVSKHISSDNRFFARADPPEGGYGSWFGHSGVQFCTRYDLGPPWWAGEGWGWPVAKIAENRLHL
jgi:hypothetical protein